MLKTSLVVGCIALLLGMPACSSSNSEPAVSDSGTAPAIDASPADASPPVPTVAEKPAPECHDLAQEASFITGSADAGPPPTLAPLAAIQPGVYVLKSSIEYGGATVTSNEGAERTTVAFTATKQYYVAEIEGKSARRIISDWTFANGELTRTPRCATDSRLVGREVKHSVGASDNGFTLSASLTAGRTSVFRYERVR